MPVLQRGYAGGGVGHVRSQRDRAVEVLLGPRHLNSREQRPGSQVAPGLRGHGGNVAGAYGSGALRRYTDDLTGSIDHRRSQLSQCSAAREGERSGAGRGRDAGTHRLRRSAIRLPHPPHVVVLPGVLAHRHVTGTLHRNVQHGQVAGDIVRGDPNAGVHPLAARQHDHDRIGSADRLVGGEQEIRRHEATHAARLGEPEVVRFNTSYVIETGSGYVRWEN